MRVAKRVLPLLSHWRNREANRPWAVTAAVQACEQADDKSAAAFVGSRDEAVDGTVLPGNSTVGVLSAGRALTRVGDAPTRLGARTFLGDHRALPPFGRPAKGARLVYSPIAQVIVEQRLIQDVVAAPQAGVVEHLPAGDDLVGDAAEAVRDLHPRVSRVLFLALPVVGEGVEVAVADVHPGMRGCHVAPGVQAPAAGRDADLVGKVAPQPRNVGLGEEPIDARVGGDAATGLNVDLREPSEFLTLLERLGIELVCMSAGGPY